jgi:hypothetical protein
VRSPTGYRAAPHDDAAVRGLLCGLTLYRGGTKTPPSQHDSRYVAVLETQCRDGVQFFCKAAQLPHQSPIGVAYSIEELLTLIPIRGLNSPRRCRSANCAASVIFYWYGCSPETLPLKAGLMQVFCVSGRVATSSTAFVAAAVVSVGVLGISPAPTPHRLAAQLTSASQVAASTVQQAETALREGLEASGPTWLSTTSVHQGAAPDGSVGQVLATDAIPALPTLNPADFTAVVAAVQELIGQFVQSFLTTPDAIRVAIERVAQGDVNGAFASLEGLVILPLVNYGLSPYPQQAANAIARYLPSQLASAVTAAPAIFLFQGARTIDLYTSSRRSVVDAVQGVISSLGTFNPVVIAGAVASGLGDVIQTAVANTFGDNGAFAIVRDTIAGLLNAAFPDPASKTNTANSDTAVARTALTTRALSATTPPQSATDITQTSRSIATPTASTTDVSAAAHRTADEAKPDVQQTHTKTVDVTSGNKVEPKIAAGTSATPRNPSVKEPSHATAASPAKVSPTTARSDAGKANTKSTSATP